MEAQTILNIIAHIPAGTDAKEELMKKVAALYADEIIRRAAGLPCRNARKVELMETIMQMNRKA